MEDMTDKTCADAGPSGPVAALKSLFFYTGAGAIGTAVHFTVLFVTLDMLGPVLASTVGAVFGLVTNYVLARNYVFASSAAVTRSFPRFATVAVFGIAVNAAIIKTFVGVLPIALNQAIASGTVLILGFILNKRWTFNDR